MQQHTKEVNKVATLGTKHAFDKEKFIADVKENVRKMYRLDIEEASQQQIFQAVSDVIEDSIIDEWMDSCKAFNEQKTKIVYYLSMEFLIGRALGNNLLNLGEYEGVKEALEELGLDINAIEDQEPDPALGNGGLGRLAACFMDSLATGGYHAYGCGIRYHYGMFRQKIVNGFQKEVPDNWLKNYYPFELKRPEHAKEVRFGGNTRIEYDQATGQTHYIYENYSSVRAVPYDIPVVGYKNHVVDTLRIWDAEAINDFELSSFDRGEYDKAVEQDNLARTITEVLYPNDNHMAGKELRLKQQYFFISASVQTALEKQLELYGTLDSLPEHAAFQLNDTHPTVAIPELMRLLMDVYGYGWDQAWDITTRSCAYTNHTIMAEALEKWPIDLFSRLLPRIYQIVEEINRRFLNEIQAKYPGNNDKIKNMAIIYDGQVRMAYLAIVGGHSVNGVAELHTEILKKDVLKDFYEMMPQKFNNKTNGITQRRFLLHGNPLLASWVTDKVGDGWITDLSKINHIEVDPNSIFDVQVKRLHEYKRQLLNIMHVMYLRNQLKEHPEMAFYPRTFIFGAKASAGYQIAKLIIKLINSVADSVNNDPDLKGKLKVVFIEDYKVSNGEIIFAAADVSEQISTASKEASGTGNMKFMLNGAPTLGTMDGANVEIVKEVGKENAFMTNKYGPADRYFILADFRSYADAQKRVEKAYLDKAGWARMAMMNTACSGKFSSDRTIKEYVDDIWHLDKVVIDK